MKRRQCDIDGFAASTTSAVIHNRRFYEQIPPEVWCVHVLRKLDVTSIHRFAAASRHFWIIGSTTSATDAGAADIWRPSRRWICSAVLSLQQIMARYRQRLHQGQHQLEHLCVNNDLLERFPNLLILELDDDVCCITNEALSALRHLRALDLRNDTRITDAGLRQMTQLRVLQLAAQPNVTDSSISLLQQLAHLDLGWNTLVTDAGVAALHSSLQILNLSHNGGGVTDSGLARLTGLTQLNLDNNRHISDAAFTAAGALAPLTPPGQQHWSHQLTSLSLGINHRITDAALSQLTALLYLSLSCSVVTDRGLAPLTRLQRLRLDNTPGVSGRALAALKHLHSLSLRDTRDSVTDVDIRSGALTSLHTLELRPGVRITDHGLSLLTGLTALALLSNDLTDAALVPLTALTRLGLFRNANVTPAGLTHLTGLRSLSYQYCAQLAGDNLQAAQLPALCRVERETIHWRLF